MTRHVSAAHTNADRPAPMVAACMSIFPGTYQRAEESAPRMPAAAVRNVCTGGA